MDERRHGEFETPFDNVPLEILCTRLSWPKSILFIGSCGRWIDLPSARERDKAVMHAFPMPGNSVQNVAITPYYRSRSTVCVRPRSGRANAMAI